MSQPCQVWLSHGLTSDSKIAPVFEIADRTKNGCPAYVPVPAKLTFCGLPPPLSPTETLAVRDPLAKGVNVTVIKQLFACGNGLAICVSLGKVVLSAPVIEIPAMFTATLLLLLSEIWQERNFRLNFGNQPVGTKSLALRVTASTFQAMGGTAPLWRLPCFRLRPVPSRLPVSLRSDRCGLSSCFPWLTTFRLADRKVLSWPE